jgi:hypothetical protein
MGELLMDLLAETAETLAIPDDDLIRLETAPGEIGLVGGIF